MDVVSLRAFCVVAQLGSFTAAAHALGFTQSAISRQIVALERDLGAQLFDRLPSGVRLTDAGICLLEHAEAVLHRLDGARRDLTALRELTAGRLRLGAFPTADAALVPRALAAFRATHPGVATSLHEGLTPDHVKRLHSGEIDLAVISAYTDPAVDGLELRHLLDDPMFVALPANHRLADRGDLRLSELADESWVAGSRRPEETLISACLQSGFQPRIEFVVREWVAKQGFVAAGLGVTLIPSLAAGTARRDIKLAALHPDDVPVRSIYTATSETLAKPASVGTFLSCLGDVAKSLILS